MDKVGTLCSSRIWETTQVLYNLNAANIKNLDFNLLNSYCLYDLHGVISAWKIGLLTHSCTAVFCSSVGG